MKRPGYCTLCEKEVREVLQRHTKGVLKGEPIKLGEWRDNAWRLTYELSDGTTCDITFCTDCVGADFENVWAAVKERFLWEDDLKVRKARNLPERTIPEQHRHDKVMDHILSQKIVREVGRRMWKFVDHKFGHLT